MAKQACHNLLCHREHRDRREKSLSTGTFAPLSVAMAPCDTRKEHKENFFILATLARFAVNIFHVR